MDFSNANTALWGIVLQLGVISSILLLSNFLRRRIKAVRKSLMPTAVLGGFIVLLIRSLGVFGPDSVVRADLLEMITYHGIAIGFIALSLRVSAGRRDASRLTAPKSGALIASCYTIQGIFGLIISLALSFTLMPGFFRAAGILLPMGYGQGPGQANNVGSVYESLGFAGGRSFGLALAASGYLCACVVGVIYLNILNRKGKIRITADDDGEESGSITVDTFQDKGEIPISESVDRFSVQAALVIFVYLLTYVVMVGLTELAGLLGDGVKAIAVPLIWGFGFIFGSVLAILFRVALKQLRRRNIMKRQYQNNYLLSRISGIAFDMMIIAGIGSINISDLGDMWLPFALMSLAGGSVTFFYLKWVSKKLYGGYYYEGMLSMYGMMTGTISSGVLLLREIDPLFETPASNNLVTGSGFAVIFGAPMLALIGLAPGSAAMTFAVLGILVVYTALLLLFMIKVRPKDGK
jgi:ESS family glutamate:Na+ symporter